MFSALVHGVFLSVEDLLRTEQSSEHGQQEEVYWGLSKQTNVLSGNCQLSFQYHCQSKGPHPETQDGHWIEQTDRSSQGTKRKKKTILRLYYR